MRGGAHTVDGRNPAPVDMVNIAAFTGFYTSQVVQDFFHQQFHASTKTFKKKTTQELSWANYF